jgi:hypothetical protein
MQHSWVKKGWKVVAQAARRISGINTPFGGVQLSTPAPDTSFVRAQDERELRYEIWLLAVQEAYVAKDGVRRMQEMQGKSELQLVEYYLAANPEIQRWVNRNIELGTCAAAVAELRDKKERFRQARLQQIKQRAI